MLTLTYEYKAMPTGEQAHLIERTLTVCRKVWNFALREHKEWLNSRKCSINACSVASEYIISANQEYPNYNHQGKYLTLLRGRGWQSALKKEQSHFDKVEVESRVLGTYRPITEKDIPDADIIMATSWETAEWVAKLSPNTGTKVYFLQHYEAFDYLPWKGDKES